MATHTHTHTLSSQMTFIVIFLLINTQYMQSLSLIEYNIYIYISRAVAIACNARTLNVWSMRTDEITTADDDETNERLDQGWNSTICCWYFIFLSFSISCSTGNTFQCSRRSEWCAQFFVAVDLCLCVIRSEMEKNNSITTFSYCTKCTLTDRPD